MNITETVYRTAQNEIHNSAEELCNTCTHSDVCMFRDKIEDTIKSVNTAISDDSRKFISLEVGCKFRKDKTTPTQPFPGITPRGASTGVTTMRMVNETKPDETVEIQQRELR